MAKNVNNPFINGREHYLTDPVFLIGNGQSRQNFDLERLRPIGTIIGCNAIYRDFNPDILVAIDSKMLNELNKAKYHNEGTILITPHNRSIALPGAFLYKSKRFNTSGAFSMRLISDVMKPEKCYMLGMDGYPGNVYDGTKNYATHTLKNFSGIHRYYLEIINGSSVTEFVNVNEEDRWPIESENSGSYSFMSYEEFENTVIKNG